jgi:prepilin-type N-terminal cleavage/methylation domain-containing protein
MTYKKAFTLIELLVVIAIIAILAAILFPVFAQAKTAAKKTQSLSNIKNIGTANQIYLADNDDMLPQSEYGGWDGIPHVQWYAAIYPYIKNGRTITQGGTTVSWGQDGIFRPPSYPIATGTGTAQAGGQGYGAHNELFVNNYGHDNRGGWMGPANAAVPATAVDNISDKIFFLEKGAPATDWSYPWFHVWQDKWISGGVAVTPGVDPGTPRKDGVEVYTRGGPFFNALADTDCRTSTDWDCAAHPRYRYNETTVASMGDSSAKAFKKGGIQWYKNLWIDRRRFANTFEWYYDYCKGGGWGFPCIH